MIITFKKKHFRTVHMYKVVTQPLNENYIFKNNLIIVQKYKVEIQRKYFKVVTHLVYSFQILKNNIVLIITYSY